MTTVFGRSAILIAILALAAANPAAAADHSDLVKKLGHFDYKERLAAIAALEAAGGPDAAKAIAGALGDEDWGVQVRAIEALGKLAIPETAEAVARAAVEGQIIVVRRAAVAALVPLKETGIYDRLLKTVARGRESTPRIRALEAAGELAGPEHVETIAAFLGDREESVRAAACLALGETGAAEAGKFLAKMTRDKRIEVRVAAIVGLGGVGGPEAMEAIATLVANEHDPYVLERAVRSFRRFPVADAATYLATTAARMKQPEVKARLVRMLGELDKPEAAPALRGFVADPAPAIRAFAARGLGRAGDATAVEDLKKLLANDADDTVRRMALEAVVRLLPTAERVPFLVAALANEAPEIRIRAAVLLAREGDATVTAALAPLVKEPGWLVPTAAMISVGILGHREEIPILAARVKDPDWKVRAAAIESLGQLRHIDVFPYLIDALEDRDPVVASAGLKNLQVLAQRQDGPDPAKWRAWYEANKDSYDLTKKGFREEVPDDAYAKDKYLIEILNRAQIVCVVGKWDKAEVVLGHLGIRHTVIRPQEITEVGLNPKQLLIINCEGTIGKKEAIERLQWFVHVGGYLMATDWALTNAVIRAFPGYVDMDSKSKTGNDVVVIEEAQPDHPLLRDLFHPDRKLKWWLEVIAFPMRVNDPFRTEVLIDSLEMLAKYNASTMAAMFEFGHGKVEQCVSHVFLQEEGLASVTTLLDRKIFAADSLGISLDRIRTLESLELLDEVSEKLMKEIAKDYSMFKLIVNFVREKREQVEKN